MSTIIELQNDLVAIGETAAHAFVRGTRKLKEHIEPMALGLAEAKRRYPKTSDFGAWLNDSPYAKLNKDDRAALILLGIKWNDDLAARFAELDSYSPQLIARELVTSYNKNSEDDDNDGEHEDAAEDSDTDSGFYGAERIARSNEAWDTIDPRLVRSLVAAIPDLKNRMVWEPSAGRGAMVDQLRASGIKVNAATDIKPRRDDIAQLDLLTATEMPPGADAAITNPPWGKLAAPFVRHLLKLAEARRAIVAMLLPLPWIAGRKIADLTGSPGFEEMIVPRYRARWMTEEEEAELDDGPSSPKMNHVWLVWDFARDPNLFPVIKFIDAPSENPDVAGEELLFAEAEAHPA